MTSAWRINVVEKSLRIDQVTIQLIIKKTYGHKNHIFYNLFKIRSPSLFKIEKKYSVMNDLKLSGHWEKDAGSLPEYTHTHIPASSVLRV